VLAVVACGLFLTRRSSRFFSPSVRIQIWSVWQSLVFVLNGLVFVLIGLQLRAIRTSIRGYGLATLLLDGAIFSALLILLRLVWVFPGAGLAYFLRTRLARQKEKPPVFAKCLSPAGPACEASSPLQPLSPFPPR
jgi:CPA1 family monovalent cation:H+ antiporter